jgi:pseudouridine-5'-phosphate glycosidase
MSAIALSEEVSSALESGLPVVALESTIIAHGLPRPDNFAAALEFESIVRQRGGVPATIAVIDGTPRAGLDSEALEIIASDDTVVKASVRDLGILAGTGRHGATTVAATAYLAHQAGISVFATGGLGGVHRGASTSFDESADLTVLAQSSVAVVSAGVKSVLDIAATLERLETLSVPVIGYGTDVFPAFWLPRSEHPLDWGVSRPEEVARIMAGTWGLGHRSGIVVANPVPSDKAWNQGDHDRIVQLAFDAAERQGIRGKEVTPFLLDFIQRESGGESLRVNLDVVRNNVAVATEIAKAWSELSR